MRLIPLLILVLFLSACKEGDRSTEEVESFAGVAMTIPYRIKIGHPLSPQERERIEGVIRATFTDVDQTFNKFNPLSELSQLNKIDAYVREPVSVELADILEQTADIVALSNGKFDPTVEPAQQLWQEHLEAGSKPPEEAVEAVSAAVGWNRVHYEENRFWKDNPGTRIDLGGIAKGLCVDMLTDRLAGAGFQNLFVEWGGEIRAQGNHPSGRPWTVYISRLDDTDPDHAIDYVTLNNQAIATSGDYLQRWTVGGMTYTHIVDPGSCSPLIVGGKAIASATVVAPTCAIADALATALMLFPTAGEAKAWAEKIKEQRPEISFWIITREDEEEHGL